jgi:hypothetical protein
MHRLSSVLVLVCASAVWAGPGSAKKKAPPPPAPPPPVTAPTEKVRENVPDSVLALLAGASSVQAFRVTDSGGLRPDPTHAIASDFIRGEAGKELSPEQLGALRSVLYDEQQYRFDADVSKCRFIPHLSFQFRSGKDSVEALISFSCNQVLYVVGKAGGRWLPSGTFDVQKARKALLALAKATLPKDAATQNLVK